MAADPLIGAVLAGHRIEAVIGRGGMGAVYRGRHLRLDKARAIKLLPPDLAADEAFRSRFEREWRAAAEIDHPSIVEVLDAGEQDGRLYIVMRLVDGVDLHELIAKEGALAPERAVALLGPVAEALDAAHERGLIHRDVKPSNILVAGDRAYLSDFGIAKSSTTRGLTKTGLFIGTVDYAAPEQIESRPLDRRTDVYALGGVLYSCLTGAPPYERDTDLQVLLAQLHDPVPTPSEKRSDLPAGLDAVVGRAMAKPMDERYSTCGELLEEARGVLRSQPTALAAAAVATKIDPAVLSELPRDSGDGARAASRDGARPACVRRDGRSPRPPRPPARAAGGRGADRRDGGRGGDPVRRVGHRGRGGSRGRRTHRQAGRGRQRQDGRGRGGHRHRRTVLDRGTCPATRPLGSRRARTRRGRSRPTPSAARCV